MATQAASYVADCEYGLLRACCLAVELGYA